MGVGDDDHTKVNKTECAAKAKNQKSVNIERVS